MVTTSSSLTLTLGVCNEIWKFVVYGISDLKEDTNWFSLFVRYVHTLWWAGLFSCSGGGGVVRTEKRTWLCFVFFFFLTIGLPSYCRWCCRKNREGKRQRRWDLFLTVGSFCLPGVIFGFLYAPRAKSNN